MMTCAEASRLISERKDHPLTLRQRIGLRLHLAMCAMCRGYKKNLDMLSRIAARAGEAVMTSFGRTDDDLALSGATKQRIREELEKARSRE